MKKLLLKIPQISPLGTFLEFFIKGQPLLDSSSWRTEGLNTPFFLAMIPYLVFSPHPIKFKISYTCTYPLSLELAPCK